MRFIDAQELAAIGQAHKNRFFLCQGRVQALGFTSISRRRESHALGTGAGTPLSQQMSPRFRQAPCAAAFPRSRTSPATTHCMPGCETRYVARCAPAILILKPVIVVKWFFPR